MKKKETTPQKKLSPNDQSREIVEFLSNCEHIRLKLHTAICHGLEKKEIEKLYKLIEYEQKNKGNL